MEQGDIVILLIIFFMLFLSAFFSGSETALTAVSRARIYRLVKQGNARARIVERLRLSKESLLAAILLGNNLVNIAAASLATIVAIHWWGDEWGPLYATIAMTLLVFIFAEVLPKTVALKHTESVALGVSPFISVLVRVLVPVTKLVYWLIRRIMWLLRIDAAGTAHLISGQEALRGAIELHHSEGAVVKEYRDMLGSILDLEEREVEEVMVHRKTVEAIDFGQEPEDIIQQVISSAHSRLPLWKDDPDNIIGLLHVKDLLRLLASKKAGITREMIRRTASRPWFVPDTTTLADQLIAFREKRKHFALVVDEYGAWQGIVTLEDIIEEIVGKIDDEHDQITIADIMPFGEGAYRVAGTVTIRDLNRHLDWNLPDEHAATVAGLVLHEARVIPEEGAVFAFYGYRFEVIAKKANQITELIVEKPQSEAGLGQADEQA